MSCSDGSLKMHLPTPPDNTKFCQVGCSTIHFIAVELACEETNYAASDTLAVFFINGRTEDDVAHFDLGGRGGG